VHGQSEAPASRIKAPGGGGGGCLGAYSLQCDNDKIRLSLWMQGMRCWNLSGLGCWHAYVVPLVQSMQLDPRAAASMDIARCW